MYRKKKREEMMYGGMRKKKGHGGRMKYRHGGDVIMEGSQPKYKGTPKCMPN